LLSGFDLLPRRILSDVKCLRCLKRAKASAATRYAKCLGAGRERPSGLASQPVDFFGTGPRIPMIAVSPYSTGGHISHVYNEHSSVVKFIERNWKLDTKLTSRSRDNLPNPHMDDENPYVRTNMPAIGELFDLFHFADGDDRG
jgi:hypothetical protein